MEKIQISDVSKLTQLLHGFLGELVINRNELIITIPLSESHLELFKKIYTLLLKDYKEELGVDHKHIFEPYESTDVCIICGLTSEEINEIEKTINEIKEKLKKLEDGEW